MKTKLFITAIFMTICMASMAQFRVQLAVGYSSATGDLGDGANGGIGGATNVRYAISDRFDVGLEYSGNVLASVDVEAFDIGLYGIRGITAKTHFKITDTKVHPYAALALGIYTVETPEIKSGGVVISESEKSSNFGFSPEIGLNFGGFGIGVKYTNAGEVPDSDNIKATYLNYFIGYTFRFGD